MKQWEEKDDPILEHERHTGKACLFMEMSKHKRKKGGSKQGTGTDMDSEDEVGNAGVISADGWKLDIDGITVMRTGIVNFSMPPTYVYVIKETGEKFNSHSSDILEAYLEWKERMKNRKPKCDC